MTDHAAYIRRQSLLAELARDAEQAARPKTCNKHPDAPHGYDGWRSYDEDRYVCDCESWVPLERASAPEPVAYTQLVGGDASAFKTQHTPPAPRVSVPKHGDQDVHGLIYVMCKVDPSGEWANWLFVPHADGNYVSASKLQPFTMAIIRAQLKHTGSLRAQGVEVVA